MRDEAAYLGKHSGSIRGRERKKGGDLGGKRLKHAEGLERVCDAVTPRRVGGGDFRLIMSAASSARREDVKFFKRSDRTCVGDGVPCSTMPAVVPATALTEAGAVVCRPTETQTRGRRKR